MSWHGHNGWDANAQASSDSFGGSFGFGGDPSANNFSTDSNNGMDFTPGTTTGALSAASVDTPTLSPPPGPAVAPVPPPANTAPTNGVPNAASVTGAAVAAPTSVITSNSAEDGSTVADHLPVVVASVVVVGLILFAAIGFFLIYQKKKRNHQRSRDTYFQENNLEISHDGLGERWNADMGHDKAEEEGMTFEEEMEGMTFGEKMDLDEYLREESLSGEGEGDAGWTQAIAPTSHRMPPPNMPPPRMPPPPVPYAGEIEEQV